MAGATGVEDLGLNPDTPPTGNFARHLRLVLGLEDEAEKLYWIDVPSYCKYSKKMTNQKLPVLPPPEGVEEFSTIEHEIKNLQEWPESLRSHPVVQKVGQENISKVVPYALYVDAAPFTKPESFYGIWFEDLRAGRIQLIFVMLT